ncbi:MAG: hypothetical protein FWB72_05880 [Firmicutes bacterium]|nr:hypothetical protein [Bacillota bacterium]
MTNFENKNVTLKRPELITPTTGVEMNSTDLCSVEGGAALLKNDASLINNLGSAWDSGSKKEQYTWTTRGGGGPQNLQQWFLGTPMASLVLPGMNNVDTLVITTDKSAQFGRCAKDNGKWVMSSDWAQMLLGTV